MTYESKIKNRDNYKTRFEIQCEIKQIRKLFGLVWFLIPESEFD